MSITYRLIIVFGLDHHITIGDIKEDQLREFISWLRKKRVRDRIFAIETQRRTVLINRNKITSVICEKESD